MRLGKGIAVSNIAIFSVPKKKGDSGKGSGR